MLMHLPVSTQTLALVALCFSVTSQAINVTTLVKKILAARVRKIDEALDDALGMHVLPKPKVKDPTLITVADIVEIRIKPRT